MVKKWWRKDDKDERRTGDSRTDDERRDYRDIRPWFRDPFDDFFGGGLFREIEEEFERMHREMDELMARAMRGELPSPEEGGPVVYGFSMRVGPDGKPEVREFGNTRLVRGFPEVGGRSETKELPGRTGDEYLFREPITDIFEGDDTVSIIAEMPGVDKSDIDLSIDGDTVTIHVDTPARKYHKTLQLPAEVKEDGVKATYRNGVLEIRMERKKKKERKGRKIKVE